MSKIIDFDGIGPSPPDSIPVVPKSRRKRGGGNTRPPPRKGKKNTSSSNSSNKYKQNDMEDMDISDVADTTEDLGEKKQISPSVHWIFTLNNPTEEEKKLFKLCQRWIKRYIFQLEKGEKCGTLHLQGYVEFIEKVRPLSIVPSTRIKWMKCLIRGRKNNYADAIAYCQKQSTKVAGPWFYGIAPMRLDTVCNDTNLTKWMKDLVYKLDKTPDDRTVRWWWSEKGGFGKSQFAKYLFNKYNGIMIGDRACDMAQAIRGWAEENKGQCPWLCIIDLARHQGNKIDWSGIEQVKNGSIFSPKFKSIGVRSASPHVVIFSNSPPDWEGNISEDKIKIVDIENKYPQCRLINDDEPNVSSDAPD